MQKLIDDDIRIIKLLLRSMVQPGSHARLWIQDILLYLDE